MSNLKMNCGYCGRKCNLDKDFCIPQDSVYICKSCYDWKQKVDDLEAKIKESEKLKDDAMYNLAWLNQELSDTNEKLSIERRAYNILHGNYSTLISSYDQLKQQLAEKEKDFKDAEQCAIDYQDRNTELEQEVNHFKGLLDLEVAYRNKLLKKQNQTAIDELEKVKKLGLQHIIDIKNDLSEEHDEYLNQKHTIHGCSIVISDIDQQIKELKGESR